MKSTKCWTLGGKYWAVVGSSVKTYSQDYKTTMIYNCWVQLCNFCVCEVESLEDEATASLHAPSAFKCLHQGSLIVPHAHRGLITLELQEFTHSLVIPVIIGLLAVAHHLPQQHTKAPHITACRELAIGNSFWCCPAHWDLTTLYTCVWVTMYIQYVIHVQTNVEVHVNHLQIQFYDESYMYMYIHVHSCTSSVNFNFKLF